MKIPVRYFIYVRRRKHYQYKGSIKTYNAHSALSLWLGSKVKAYRYRQRKNYGVTAKKHGGKQVIVKATTIEQNFTYLYSGW
ncbi:MAG: hypothetical protein A2836_02020 [Candidatus Taylorbacteria bacterium RIFCSPHIGHO2_01_FULL_45_63]|uniref:Uncharacterized protein n=1 Tax=Candidatus Taylorbacteria bacterium RIFCSPHIGHO2_02_FULL_45_35 TaxID=1802311 RepID=A0A1G2MUM3_9BACT|nr:MAG: hypothetical protein A2836_02020 [Candidatus Taylorbacteria bacterium RIFCSPHIGHO2_01_FULL_45_63]OHA27454.1 MAG: hypothetical protein A3D56_00665 [Candidatus Taylorbacteria bacterium RIFCSPHIGHO2_02_FULL_45_35]OHA34493.1 MAG: hypothetical protein A3A22_02670 [Candidatus Taylorbacteria bacterium RIFCSPLOWO2_01_FULL_45_34b]